MRRVRIQNNGEPAYRTKVTDAETGVELPNVANIYLRIDPKEDVQAIIRTYLPVIDVTTNAQTFAICPACHERMNFTKVSPNYVEFFKREYGVDIMDKSQLSHIMAEYGQDDEVQAN